MSRTTLVTAAQDGNEDELNRLLDGGADINSIESQYGYTALHWASAFGRTACVDCLLARRAKLDVQNNIGWTPLMVAAGEGRTSIVQKLLSAGADPTLKDKDGRTALDHALQKGNAECIEVFEKCSAVEKTAKRVAVVLLLCTVLFYALATS